MRLVAFLAVLALAALPLGVAAQDTVILPPPADAEGTETGDELEALATPGMTAEAVERVLGAPARTMVGEGGGRIAFYERTLGDGRPVTLVVVFGSDNRVQRSRYYIGE